MPKIPWFRIFSVEPCQSQQLRNLFIL